MSDVLLGNSGNWVAARNGTGARVGSINPEEVLVGHGGEWRSVWTRSDPVVVSLDATTVESFRQNASMQWNPTGNAGYLYVGAFAGTFPRDLIGCAAFNVATLVANLAERPVVKSAEVRFRREGAGGAGVSSATGTIYGFTYNGAVGSGTPDYDLLDASNAGSVTFAGGSPMGWSHNVTVPLTPQVVARIAAGQALALSARTSGWSTNKGATDSIYSRHLGPSTSSPAGRKPTLVVTLDYV